MSARLKHRGFSIAEVLIAVGILAVAMVLIAGVFPVGIRFTQISIDKTTAAIAANEAFATVQLYAQKAESALNYLDYNVQRDFNDLIANNNADNYILDVDEFTYPTDDRTTFKNKPYSWAALCRRVHANNVQVTVFVNRKAGNKKYILPDFNYFGSALADRYGEITDEISNIPQLVKIEVNTVPNKDNELEILDNDEKYIDNGAILVEDSTGMIYRVLDRYPQRNQTEGSRIILLDKDFDLASGTYFVWVIPPTVQKTGTGLTPSGLSPCVGVFQKVVRF